MTTAGRKPKSLVGSYLRQKRELRRISQKQLGLRFNPPVTTQFISNLERGVTPLPAHHVPTLAQALDLQETEILAILEQEYAQKITRKIQRPTATAEMTPATTLCAIFVEEKDADFFRALYGAYVLASPEVKQKLSKECESLLGMTK